MNIKDLEEISLKSLYKLCPLCGQPAENFYCKPCDFHYEEGKIYFSRVQDFSSL